MPDVAWIVGGYVVGMPLVVLAALFAIDAVKRRSRRREFARIEEYANRGESAARRDTRTQTSVTGVLRNPPRAVAAAEAASHDPKETAS